MKNEKTWNMVGMVLGIIVILIGIIFCMTPSEHYTTSSTENASFGADYYTYEYDATRTAASNAAITANNIRELGGKIAIYVGTFFIIMGALILICYGRKYFCENIKLQSPIVSEIETGKYVEKHENDTDLNLQESLV